MLYVLRNLVLMTKYTQGVNYPNYSHINIFNAAVFLVEIRPGFVFISPGLSGVVRMYLDNSLKVEGTLLTIKLTTVLNSAQAAAIFSSESFWKTRNNQGSLCSTELMARVLY